MIKIRSNRLAVSIFTPAEAPSNSQRFDHTAFIPQIILDGKYHFCSVEPQSDQHLASGGQGICSEIQCEDADKLTKTGDRFPKFGVGGLLKEDNESYQPFKRYKNEPFIFHCSAKESQAVFYVDARAIAGMALEEEKLITVNENRLQIKYRFANKGSVPLTLREHCHNYVTLDGPPAEEKYRLTIPTVSPQAGEIPMLRDGNLQYAADGRAFGGAVENHPFPIAVNRESIDRDKAFSWTLTHEDTPLRITGQPDFIPSKFVVWRTRGTVCANVFHEFRLKPKEHITYHCTWIFERD